VVSAGSDGLVRVWDARTGVPQGVVADSAGGSDQLRFAVKVLATAPNGRMVATATSDGGPEFSVGLWDVDGGRHLNTFMGHAAPVRAVAFNRPSQDGRILLVTATAPEKRPAELRLEPETPVEIPVAPKKDIFSPPTLSAASQRNRGMSIASAAARLAQQQSAAQQGGMAVAGMSPTGADRRAAIGATPDGPTGILRIFDPRTAAMLAMIAPFDAGVAINALDVIPDDIGAQFTGLTQGPLSVALVAAGSDGTARILCVPAVPTGSSPKKTADGASSVAAKESVAPPSASSPPTGVSTAFELAATLTGHRDSVNDACFVGRGHGANTAALRFVTGSRDNSVKLWLVTPNAEAGKPAVVACIATCNGHTQAVAAVAASASGVLVASAGDRSVRVWCAFSGNPVRHFETHGFGVRSVAFDLTAGRLVASCGDDGVVRLWPLPAAMLTAPSNAKPVAPARYTAVADGTIHLTDQQAPEARRQVIVAGGATKTPVLQSAADGKPLAYLFGHTGYVHTVDSGTYELAHVNRAVADSAAAAADGENAAAVAGPEPAVAATSHPQHGSGASRPPATTTWCACGRRRPTSERSRAPRATRARMPALYRRWLH
jgi:WD40 repeat protein